MLCNSPAAGQAQFRRAVFNLFAANQDDHSKNWAFLQNDHGQWQLAPHYDITFSPSPYGEHATAFAGHGKTPTVKAMQQLATQANFSAWQQAQQVIEEVLAALSQWPGIAKNLGVSQQTVTLITKTLGRLWRDNRHLI